MGDVFMTKRFSKAEMGCFLSSVLVGLFAHGFIFANNITLHDNVYNMHMGGTYSLGRWMLAKLVRLMDVLCGPVWFHFSTPWSIGLLTIVFIGLSGMLIVRMLGISDCWAGVIIGGVMVTFPPVISLFGYMFTAGMYSFGLLLAVAGVFFACSSLTKKPFLNMIFICFGIGLEACSVGVYQANIGIILSLSLLVFLRRMEAEEQVSLGKLLKRVAHNIGVTIAYLGLYFAASAFFLRRVGETLSNYRGLNEAGDEGIWGILSRIPTCYREFFYPTRDSSANMYPGGVRFYYDVLLVGLLVFSCVKVYQLFRTQKLKAVFFLLVLLVFPLAVNSIYVICADDHYTLMMYAECMVFVLMCYLLSSCKGQLAKAVSLERLAKGIIVLNMLFMIFLYSRLANICYLKADYLEKAGMMYLNRLVMRIESTENYSPELPVAFVGKSPVPDNKLFLYPEFQSVSFFPFSMNTMVTDYNWDSFMKSTCGFNPDIIAAAPFEELEEVEMMPCYPQPGSIKVIDQCVVVKFQ